MNSTPSGLAANAPDVEADIEQSHLYHDDLTPVPQSRRKWGMFSFSEAHGEKTFSTYSVRGNLVLPKAFLIAVLLAAAADRLHGRPLAEEL